MPASAPTAHTWTLLDLRQLSAVRKEARALLLATGAAGEDGTDAAERAVLVLHELDSNALRHGSTPARVQIIDQGPTWVVVATDAARQQLPTYGLRVVTDLAISRGTHVDDVLKHVWALLPKV